MNIEFEATFPNISIADMQTRLQKIGAKCVKKRTLYKRVAFNLPHRDPKEHIWGRVRDEGNVITMTIKEWKDDGIAGQKELELQVDNYDTAIAFMNKLGCIPKSYQETYREEWRIHDVHVTLDEWPWLEPLIEIEGKSEEAVKEIVAKLEFDYSQAMFMTVTALYMDKYGLSQYEIDNNIPRITFEENPFVR